MPESVFEKYYQQRIKNIFNLLHEMEVSGSDMVLHDLRVELKKLKSILQFIRQLYDKDRIRKLYKLLNRFFHQAGEIRASQLMRQWFEQNGFDLISHTYFQLNSIDQRLSEFQSELKQFKKILKELDEHLKDPVRKINRILIEHHVNQLKIEIDRLLIDRIDEDGWHSLRKLIKQWIYSINWLDPQEQSDLFLFQKLQEMIGYWHDQLDLREWLHEHEKEIKNRANLQQAFALASAKSLRSSDYRAKKIRALMRTKPNLKRK